MASSSRLNTIRTGLQLGITCFDISVKVIVNRTLDEEANERDKNVLINLLEKHHMDQQHAPEQDGRYIPAYHDLRSVPASI